MRTIRPWWGRECGACNVCCVVLTIDDAELRRIQGYRCVNSWSDRFCAILETRPRTCRTFYYGWRLLKWVKAKLRPDQSDAVIGLHRTSPAGETPERFSVSFTLMSNAVLKAEGLAETVAAATPPEYRPSSVSSARPATPAARLRSTIGTTSPCATSSVCSVH